MGFIPTYPIPPCSVCTSQGWFTLPTIMCLSALLCDFQQKFRFHQCDLVFCSFVGDTSLHMCIIKRDVDWYLDTGGFVYFLVKGSVHPVTSVNLFWNLNCHKWLMVSSKNLIHNRVETDWGNILLRMKRRVKVRKLLPLVLEKLSLNPCAGNLLFVGNSLCL